MNVNCYCDVCKSAWLVRFYVDMPIGRGDDTVLLAKQGVVRAIAYNSGINGGSPNGSSSAKLHVT
jgi:hypothetical protein